ncbi:Gfo/Idh/MocA family protein [Marinicrinis sediminis]|uniref:Gfo/Idh/MocA family protein n=1 Tax=Marinicrinis sediminis TaxID=1652465 RepID=A0ABW5R7K4_9BACL
MGLTYAIIGCGRISPNHIAAAIENQMKVVALCDTDPKKMAGVAAQFDLPETTSCYTDYRELIREEQVDLIAICTDSGRHASIAIDCIQAGIHLIIEKPIALSIEDADQIIELANKHRVKVSACHQYRFNKAVQQVRKAVEEERFGRLMYGTATTRWYRDESYYAQADWRGTWELDGGTLMNQCIHNIDLLRWMMGDEVKEVIGLTDNLNHPYIEAEDIGLAMILFENGGYGLVEGTANTYPLDLEETLYLSGVKGTAKAGGKSVNLIEEWHFSDGQDDPDAIRNLYKEMPPNVYGFGHERLYEDVKEAIEQDREPYVTAEDGKKAVELVLAIYQSAAEGKRITLPLKSGSTMDYTGRFDQRNKE